GGAPPRGAAVQGSMRARVPRCSCRATRFLPYSYLEQLLFPVFILLFADFLDAGREIAKHGPVEDRADRQLAAECLAQVHDQFRGEQRMAAKVEKIVVASRPFDTQHFL